MAEFERVHNGAYGWVCAGEFWRFPNVAVSYGPLSFKTHDLDKHGWRASFAQKRCAQKPMKAYVRLYHPDQRNSGFTIKLPAKAYSGWQDVMAALATVSGGIQFHAKQEIGRPDTMIMTETIERPIIEVLEKHNAKALADLGDWRPDPLPAPDETNVVRLARVIAMIEAEAA